METILLNPTLNTKDIGEYPMIYKPPVFKEKDT